MARKAALAAEYAALSEHRELGLQELTLRQKKAELQLQTKLSSIEAQEKDYAQIEDQKSTVGNSPLLLQAIKKTATPSRTVS